MLTTSDLKIARALSASSAPYLSSILYAFTFVSVEDKDLPYVACDKSLNFYFNPNADMTMDELVGAVLHECGHVFRQHFSRRGVRNPRKWNIAGDAVINKDIRDAGLSLPPGTIDYKVEGIPLTAMSSTESVYEYAFGNGDDGNDDGGGDSDEDSDDSGEGSSDAGGDGDSDSDGDSDQSQGQGQGRSQSEDGGDDGDGEGSGEGSSGEDGDWDAGGEGSGEGGGCGSASDGVARSYEVPATTPPSVVASAIEESAEDAINAEGQQPGSVPAGILRSAHRIKKKSKSAEKVLRNIIGGNFTEKVSGASDYTYTRPNKRHNVKDVILPSLYDQETELVVGVAVDTSASMSKEHLGQALGVFESMSKAVNMSIVAVAVDVVAGDVQKINPHGIKDFFSKKLTGGGGTNLVPGAEAICDYTKKNRLPPIDIMIFLSDGFVFFEHTKPKFLRNIPTYMIVISTRNDFAPPLTSYPHWLKALDCS